MLKGDNPVSPAKALGASAQGGCGRGYRLLDATSGAGAVNCLPPMNTDGFLLFRLNDL